MKSLFLLLLFFVIAGCNHSTETTLNRTGVSWTVPGFGATFIYEINVSYIPGAEFDTEEVTATGLTIGGKTNVIRTSSHITFDPPQIKYIAYEANGDISLGTVTDTFKNIIAWKTYPTSTDGTISDPMIDTPAEFGKNIISNSRTFVDTETISSFVGNVSTIQIHELTRNIFVSGTSPIDTSYLTYDYWFAPSLGEYVKEMIVQNSGSDTAGFSSENLIVYIPH